MGGPAARRLDVRTLLLGGPARYSRDELVRAARVPLAEARRVWRALGFPDVGDAAQFTDNDLAALTCALSLVERGVLDPESLIETARALGHTTSRLADWQLDTLRRQWREGGQAHSGERPTAEEVRFVSAAVAAALPAYEQLLVHVWRRQLAATLARVFPADAEEDTAAEAVTRRATMGFADLVGFTRLARQLEDDALAHLVQTFEAVSADVVASTGARLVKTLGDEVMFAAESAEQGAETALRLHEAHAGDLDVPQLRVGLATGQVLARMGDVFGPTVNLASRLTSLARPAGTLVDSATADALHGRPAYVLRALTPRPVRGLGLVRAYALSRSREAGIG